MSQLGRWNKNKNLNERKLFSKYFKHSYLNNWLVHIDFACFNENFSVHFNIHSIPSKWKNIWTIKSNNRLSLGPLAGMRYDFVYKQTPIVWSTFCVKCHCQYVLRWDTVLLTWSNVLVFTLNIRSRSHVTFAHALFTCENVAKWQQKKRTQTPAIQRNESQPLLCVW